MRLMETVDLLGKMSASLLDRVDNQGQKIDVMVRAISKMWDITLEVQTATSSEMTEQIIAKGIETPVNDLYHLDTILHEKIRKLDELQVELKELIQQSEAKGATLRRDRWIAVGSSLLIFAAGLGTGLVV